MKQVIIRRNNMKLVLSSQINSVFQYKYILIIQNLILHNNHFYISQFIF